MNDTFYIYRKEDATPAKPQPPSESDADIHNFWGSQHDGYTPTELKKREEEKLSDLETKRLTGILIYANMLLAAGIAILLIAVFFR